MMLKCTIKHGGIAEQVGWFGYQLDGMKKREILVKLMIIE